MIAQHLLKAAGRLEAALYKLPVVGEPCVRGMNRAAAHAAFHAPVLGGKRGRTIAEVRDGWTAFLARAGITPVILKEEADAFHWEVDGCPYGYCAADQRAVCDAAMDLDRTYTRLLGGELTILDRIPDGSSKCRYITRLAR